MSCANSRREESDTVVIELMQNSILQAPVMGIQSLFQKMTSMRLLATIRVCAHGNVDNKRALKRL